MEQVKNFIDLVASGNNVEAKSVLEDILSTRAFESLDNKKQELASGLFGGVSEENEETVEQSEE